MKKIIWVILLLITVTDSAVFAQNLRAEFAMAEFESPSDGPYLETYLKLKGNSLVPVTVGDGYYAEVLITYHVSKGVWVPFKDSYIVKGPLNATGSVPMDFIDQRRIPLKPGSYDLEVTIKDINDSLSKAATIIQKVVIEKQKLKNLDSEPEGTSYLDTVKGKPVYRSTFSMSSIQLVDSYSETTTPNILSKVGYDLIPYTSDYYPEERTDITFYVEVYNLQLENLPADKKFLIDMFVENADDGRIVEGLRKLSKRDYAEVVPVLQSFPIERLSSGNYNLVIEVRSDENKLMERRSLFFQRTNNSVTEEYVLENQGSENDMYGSFVTQYQNLDQLKEYLRCLHPISTQEEINQVNRRMNFQDKNMMWKFMYNFWKKRDTDNPEQAWLTYWKEVEKVNANYSNNLRRGYDTDRGRVYLQYGPPNTISPNYFEPNTYPYEIWHYYKLKDQLNAEQSNKKFVFANLERGSKEFTLIHSDAKNEITNIRWNYDLQIRSNSVNDIDQEDSNDGYGNRSKQFYQNPY
ncbi:MAG: GWxTD domain-containing protein [Flavobacteriales bacterium]|nr:GWxTD domain-containing protein [Flavobacteriales bacterium]